MENSGIFKQAKSDIFKVLHPILTFYVNKGAKPASLKKYYKNNKRFIDLLDDINNKGVNLVKDETEYKKLVREILNEILDDFIAKDKDKEYKNKQESKMKHIKEFHSYNESLIGWVCVAILFNLFLRKLWQNHKERIVDAKMRSMVGSILKGLKTAETIPVVDLADRFFIRVDAKINLENKKIDFRLFKNEKILKLSIPGIPEDLVFPLLDNEYDEFLKLLKKN